MPLPSVQMLSTSVPLTTSYTIAPPPVIAVAPLPVAPSVVPPTLAPAALATPVPTVIAPPPIIPVAVDPPPLPAPLPVSVASESAMPLPGTTITQIAPAPINYVAVAQPTATMAVAPAPSSSTFIETTSGYQAPSAVPAQQTAVLAVPTVGSPIASGYTIAPPPVIVAPTSTSVPPSTPSQTVAEPTNISTGAPPSIEPEKKTAIKAPPIILVDPDTSSGSSGGGDVYDAQAEATDANPTTGEQQQQGATATAGPGFWTYQNLKWPVGLLVGAAALYFVVPKLLKKPSKSSLAGYFRRRRRHFRDIIPEDALDGRR